MELVSDVPSSRLDLDQHPPVVRRAALQDPAGRCEEQGEEEEQ